MGGWGCPLPSYYYYGFRRIVKSPLSEIRVSCQLRTALIYMIPPLPCFTHRYPTQRLLGTFLSTAPLAVASGLSAAVGFSSLGLAGTGA